MLTQVNEGRPRKFGSRLQARAPDLVAALQPEKAKATTTEVAVVDLWLDDQPRQIVPEEVMERLIAEGRAQPGALLEALRAATSDLYFAGVLAQIEELAANIAVNGVLTPILVARKGDRLLVRDGHRRTLAALVAERTRVPYHLIDESSDFVAMGQQFAANSVRVDFNALDQARWLMRMARQAEESLRAELSIDPSISVVDNLTRTEASEVGDELGESATRSLPASARELARRMQEQICSVTGLSRRQYYQLMALNRLTPDSRAIGRRLTEGQLRPVTGLRPADQVVVTAFIAQQGLGSREAATLAKVARSGDRDAVQRVMRRLAKEDTGRTRVAISFEGLLHAIPEDYQLRCSALHAELRALPDERRQVRLKTMREQCDRGRGLVREFEEMLALFDAVAPVG